MKSIERVFLYAVLGFPPPVLGMLLGWWGAYLIAPNQAEVIAGTVGLGIGILLDIIFLNKLVDRAYRLNLWIWLGLFIFYGIGLFGFFMGVPIFLLGLAPPAGFFSVARFASLHGDEGSWRTEVKRIQLITTGVVLLGCIASAVIALQDPYTAANLEGLLRLNFAVTQGMIVALILTGGAGLLALFWWLTRWTASLTHRWYKA